MIERRRLLALPALLGLPVLSGCGWEPLYADAQTDAASADLRAIKVDAIAERIGQILEFGLRESLNPSHIETKQRYELKVTLQEAQSNLGIQSQGLGTRGEVVISASYQLLELASAKPLQAAGFHANDSWDIQANGYSTVVAQHDAERRCVEELRHEIIARLSLFMQSKPTTPS
jgi:LPS-assembly lipoprotein